MTQLKKVLNSNIKHKYYIEALNISKATFYRKLKKESFTQTELKIITRINERVKPL